MARERVPVANNGLLTSASRNVHAALTALIVGEITQPQ